MEKLLSSLVTLQSSLVVFMEPSILKLGQLAVSVLVPKAFYQVDSV